MIEETIRERLWAAARARRRELVSFAQRLIRTRSLPGEEGEIAELVALQLRSLGCDEVDIDRAGNVIGRLRGTSGGPTVQLNAHLDHVHEGDTCLWPYPPYEGVVVDGVLYGRGACDVKGALASQVFALALLRDIGLRPGGDCYVTGVVQEEVGGLGAAALCEWLRTDAVVLGEATNLELRRGHRGRVGLKVRFLGRSVHASAPERGVNPLFALGRFLTRLHELPHAVHPELGASSVAPTVLRTDQESENVTPGMVRLALDWRAVPGEEPAAIRAAVESLAEECADEGVTVEVCVPERVWRSYRGLVLELPPTRGYVLPAEHPVVARARQALERVFARPVADGFWQFATDGGHFMAHGIPTIGFAPGDERLAHTVEDSVRVSDLEAATVGYAALALALTRPEVTS
ncbi:MAG: M20/M25/M40 family metallo-hydrolase [Thermomicrobium sp.]|nr:M20/M25/M40 family metallo-hydrolase [Thermomicrobium sp.]MDW8058688.1 M20/M25/M40 family metallo-hydrolase [Thermomicrobium sp.]